MLSKAHRFSKKKDVEAVFRKGKFYRNRNFIIRFYPNPLERSRFAVNVGKRVAAKAVTRNKLKRFVREVLRSKVKEIKSGFDIVVQVNGKIEKPSYEKISEELAILLDSAHLIK